MSEDRKPIWSSDLVPDIEIEAAADAMQALWEEGKRQGGSPSFLCLARDALEAALKVRGKTAHRGQGWGADH